MSKKPVLIIVLTIILFGTSTLTYTSQPAESLEPPPTEWARTYGGAGMDIAACVIETGDGGYAITGKSDSFSGYPDIWLVKTDSDGNMQWNQTYGGVSDDRGQSVVQTVDGGYAIAGKTSSFGAGDSDFWLVKADPSGNNQWNKTYGGINQDYALSLVQTGDGGYALAGTTHSFMTGNASFWLVKVDSSGNHQWNKTYGGADDDDHAYSVVQTGDGGYAITGSTWSFGAGERDFWLVKTDSAGNMQWNKTYGGVGIDVAYSVVQTDDGGYALVGRTYSFGPGDSASWLIKTDSNGTVQWNQTYGGSGHDAAKCVQQTVDGGYAIAGYTWSFGAGWWDSWLVKTDANGNMLWNQTFGGADEDSAYSVVQTSDGGYALAGSTSSFGAGSSDFWLIKIMPGNPPVANFTYSPGNPIVNYEITFNASSSYDLDEDIASYRWDFDDGNISSTVNSTIVHSYDSTGSYNVTLTVIDSKGLNHSYSQTVWVKIATSISISTSSPSTYVGFKVNITGSLSDMYGTRLRNQTVVIHYTLGGIDTWTPIASDSTDDFGNYYAMWIPTATGSFTIKADWEGNSTHLNANTITNLNTLSHVEEYIFSVESNSSVSSLAFNTTERTLSFSVSGPSDTKGYVKVTVSKTLVENITDLKVYLDGNQLNYTATSLDDSWLLYFTYLHSTHDVTITLGRAPTSFIETLPVETLILTAVSITAIIIFALYVWKKKKSPAH